MSSLTQVRAFTGVLTLVAIGAQLKTTFDAGVLNPLNFFRYFTIQSNLIGGAHARSDARRRAHLAG
jgi:hypothetical protein